MTKFVSIEYLVGNAFIYLTEERFIRLEDIYKYLGQMHNYWKSNDIDAVISGEVNSVNDFADYFEFRRDAGIIILRETVTKEDLKSRFKERLPKDISLSFEKVAEEFS